LIVDGNYFDNVTIRHCEPPTPGGPPPRNGGHGQAAKQTSRNRNEIASSARFAGLLAMTAGKFLFGGYC